MNKTSPVINRIIVERELRKQYQLHKQKIQDIYTKKPEKQYKFKQPINKKAILMEEEKRLEIQRKNQFLLEKLQKILNNNYSPQSAQSEKSVRSLNRNFRIKKLTQINQENNALVGRLINQKGQYGETRSNIKKQTYLKHICSKFKPFQLETIEDIRRKKRTSSYSDRKSSFNKSYLCQNIQPDSSFLTYQSNHRKQDYFPKPQTAETGTRKPAQYMKVSHVLETQTDKKSLENQKYEDQVQKNLQELIEDNLTNSNDSFAIDKQQQEQDNYEDDYEIEEEVDCN